MNSEMVKSKALYHTSLTRKILLFVYVIFMLLLVSLPLNDTGASFLTNTYVIKIRLDYLGHIVLFLPFLFLVKISYPIHFFKLFLCKPSV